MGESFFRLKSSVGRAGLAIFVAAAVAWPAFTTQAAARGPEGIADVAEQVIDAVVNVSTKQSVDMRNGAMPQLPPGSPFEEFFEEFFKNRRGGQGGQGRPRRTGRSRRPTRRKSVAIAVAIAAPRQLAWLRLHYRCHWTGGDE